MRYCDAEGLRLIAKLRSHRYTLKAAHSDIILASSFLAINLRRDSVMSAIGCADERRRINE
jgi:hypothetical protein